MLLQTWFTRKVGLVAGDAETDEDVIGVLKKVIQVFCHFTEGKAPVVYLGNPGDDLSAWMPR